MQREAIVYRPPSVEEGTAVWQLIRDAGVLDLNFTYCYLLLCKHFSETCAVAEDGLPHCRVLSAWVMLTENNEFNGPLYLIPGSHRYFVSCAGAAPANHHKASLRKQEYGVPGINALKELTAKGGLAAACGAPGTLILHEGNTMHGSPDNISPSARTNLFFVYNSVRNTPADNPFAAAKFRPEFLGGRDFTPLEPIDNEVA